MSMSRVLRIRLCDEDRKLYDCPEWLELDRDELDETRAEALHELETEMELTFWQLFAVLPTRAARVRRACAWLATRQAGLTIPWTAFDPKILKAEFRAGDDTDPPDEETPSDGGPPDGGSSDGSDGDPSEP